MLVLAGLNVITRVLLLTDFEGTSGSLSIEEFALMDLCCGI